MAAASGTPASYPPRTETRECTPVLRFHARVAFHGKRDELGAGFRHSERSPYVKDGIGNYIVHGVRAAVNPAQTGTKASAHYRVSVAGGSSVSIDLRLSKAVGTRIAEEFGDPNRRGAAEARSGRLTSSTAR
jgi:hypothetical protein